ncbi:MAG TPA: alpha/beta hydrolase family protein [Prolixibacteraceae bacterium]
MKSLFFLMLCLVAFSPVFAQKGKVIESLTFDSKIVPYRVKYSVYLPADYQTSQRNYPVVYLLHGYSDDETGWIQFGEANEIADKGIAEGAFPACIIIIPDGKVSWYCNSADSTDRWEDMFITELIPFVEKEYRIRAKKEFRAIAGLSMGGYGALQLSMRNPDLFSTCVALSSGTFSDEEIIAQPDDQYNMYFKRIFGDNLKGEARVSEAWKAHSPLHLIHTVAAEKLKGIRFYIDCGDDDFLYKGNSLLHIGMRDLNIPHEYRVRNGAHEWSYWRVGLYDGLKFIGEKFHR